MDSQEYPEITVQELAKKLKNNGAFYLIDVRELWELEYAQIKDAHVSVIPMSQMSREREEAFPPELRDPQTDIVVMCHHGVRSMQVTQWMRSLGWKNVYSLSGGIDAYAQKIDPSVGSY